MFTSKKFAPAHNGGGQKDDTFRRHEGIFTQQREKCRTITLKNNSKPLVFVFFPAPCVGYAALRLVAIATDNYTTICIRIQHQKTYTLKSYYTQVKSRKKKKSAAFSIIAK